MGCMLKFRLPNLYTIIIVTKIRKCFLKKKESVECFFIFIIMPSFKQVKFNRDKKEPCERGCSWIMKFFHCLNFGYRKYAIIFSIHTQNVCTQYIHEGKNLWSEQFLIFQKEFHFQERLASQWSRSLKGKSSSWTMITLHRETDFIAK